MNCVTEEYIHAPTELDKTISSMTCRTWIRKKATRALEVIRTLALAILKANTRTRVTAPSISHKAAPGLDHLADELMPGARARPRTPLRLLLPVDVTEWQAPFGRPPLIDRHEGTAMPKAPDITIHDATALADRTSSSPAVRKE